MRLLITTHGGAGHFHPLAPIADAAQRAGHRVAFATEPPFDERIRQAGYDAFAVGRPFDFGAPEQTFPEIDDLHGIEGTMWVMEHVFFGALADAARPDMERVIRDWRPDVVLNETSEISGLLAAETHGVRHATFNYGGMDLSLLRYVAGGPWDAIRARLDLAPDPDFSVLADSTVIAAMPSSWAGLEPTPRVHRVALPLYDRSPDTDPEAVRALEAYSGDVPLVYATLGTVNRDCSTLASVISAFAGMAVRAMVTTGDLLDRGTLEPTPVNVAVSTYVPHSVVLPRATVVVHHGGFNTLLGALTFGLPQVLLPMEADQPINAARAHELGLAVVISPEDRSPASIRSAIEQVIDDPGFARRARAMGAEIAALSPIESAIDALADLLISA